MHPVASSLKSIPCAKGGTQEGVERLACRELSGARQNRRPSRNEASFSGKTRPPSSSKCQKQANQIPASMLGPSKASIESLKRRKGSHKVSKREIIAGHSLLCPLRLIHPSFGILDLLNTLNLASCLLPCCLNKLSILPSPSFREVSPPSPASASSALARFPLLFEPYDVPFKALKASYLVTQSFVLDIHVV